MKKIMQPFIDRNEQEIFINVTQIIAVHKSIWGDYNVIEINGQTFEVMNSIDFILDAIEQPFTEIGEMK